MNHYAVAGFLTFIVFLILSGVVYFKNTKKKINIYFALFFFTVSLYGLGFFIQAIQSDPLHALIAIKVNLLFKKLIPILISHSSQSDGLFL